MTATNHAMTGALIGLSFSSPLALPLALVSHFMLDIVPHFNLDRVAKRKYFFIYLSMEATLLLALLAYLAISSVTIWAYVGLLLAISPDFVWGYRWIYQERFGARLPTPRNKFNEWHAKIQWSESQKGLIVEIFYGGFILYLISQAIN